MSGIDPAMIIWAILALCLIVGEMFTGEFTLLTLGIGAVFGALGAAMGFPIVAQLGVALVFSVVSLLLVTPRIRAHFAPPTTLDGIDSMVGEHVEVIEAIEPPGLGKVKLNGVVWQAESVHPIPTGAYAMVAQVVGSRLHVISPPGQTGTMKVRTGELTAESVKPQMQSESN